MKHGRDKFFSVKGIQIVINYWTKNGHKVVGFVPEYLFDYEQVGGNKRLKEMGLKETKASKMPDDMSLMHKLLEKGYLVKTPS
jgi:bifunctional pyridoxal-dependent enzyme with beta-cystathionase and maltose regulon repressor activities